MIAVADDRLRSRSPFEQKLRQAIRECWGPDPYDPADAPTQATVAVQMGYAEPRGLEKMLTAENRREQERGSRRPGLWERNSGRRP